MVREARQIWEQVFRSTSLVALSLGLAHFFESLPSNLVTHLSGSHSEFLRGKFNQLIKEPCKDILEAGRDSVEEYLSPSSDGNNLKNFDPTLRTWLENYNLCFSLVDRGDRNTYSILYSSINILKDKMSKNNRLSCLKNSPVEVWVYRIKRKFFRNKSSILLSSDSRFMNAEQYTG